MEMLIWFSILVHGLALSRIVGLKALNKLYVDDRHWWKDRYEKEKVESTKHFDWYIEALGSRKGSTTEVSRRANGEQS